MSLFKLLTIHPHTSYRRASFIPCKYRAVATKTASPRNPHTSYRRASFIPCKYRAVATHTKNFDDMFIEFVFSK